MSAYVIPNLVLLVAIVGAIGLLARHWNRAEKLAQSDAGGRRVRLSRVRWVSLGWLRRLWRFVLEAKGLHHPAARQMRMRQLLAAHKRRVDSSGSVEIFTPAEQTVLARPEQPLPAAARPAVEVRSTNAAPAAAVQVSGAEPTETAQADPAAFKRPRARVERRPKVSSVTAVAVTGQEPGAAEVARIAERAKRYLDNKQFGPARVQLLELARLDARDPLHWARLGYAQFQLGAYGEAVRCYQKSVALDSNQPNRYYNLALACDAAGRRLEALAALDKALGLEPGNEKYRHTKAALQGG